MTSTDPTPVRVDFPNGYSEIGIRIAPTVVELSWAAVGLQLRESVQIDGRAMSITAKTVRFRRGAEQDGWEAQDGTVRITFEELKV